MKDTFTLVAWLFLSSVNYPQVATLCMLGACHEDHKFSLLCNHMNIEYLMSSVIFSGVTVLHVCRTGDTCKECWQVNEPW